MITFELNDIKEDKLYWLYKNIGHGGRWLVKNGKVEPEPGDDWGWYRETPYWYKIAFLDEKKALLYSLRWA